MLLERVRWWDISKSHQETKRSCPANDYWLMWTESDSNNVNRQTDWQSDEIFPPAEALLPEFPFQSLARSSEAPGPELSGRSQALRLPTAVSIYAVILLPTCEEVHLIYMHLSPPSVRLATSHPLIVKE